MAKPHNETTFEAELTRLRTLIENLKDRLDWLHGAPMPLDEAKQQVTERVRAMAKNDPLMGKVGYFCRPGYGAHDLITAPGGDFTSVLCALMPDLIEQRLHQILEEHYRTVEAGPPMAERADRRLKLEQQLFDLELLEERLICDWERERGQVYPRRPDCNPGVVLGFWDKEAA